MAGIRFLTATSIGAIVLGAGGLLTYGGLLPAFLPDFLNAGSAVGVLRSRVAFEAVALGMVANAALLTLVIELSRTRSAVAGALLAALVAALQWMAADWLLYAVANIGDVRGVMLDPLLKAGPAAGAGAVIATVLKIQTGAARHAVPVRL
jgi:hypothetical protein